MDKENKNILRILLCHKVATWWVNKMSLHAGGSPMVECRPLPMLILLFRSRLHLASQHQQTVTLQIAKGVRRVKVNLNINCKHFCPHLVMCYLPLNQIVILVFWVYSNVPSSVQFDTQIDTSTHQIVNVEPVDDHWSSDMTLSVSTNGLRLIVRSCV